MKLFKKTLSFKKGKVLSDHSFKFGMYNFSFVFVIQFGIGHSIICNWIIPIKSVLSLTFDKSEYIFVIKVLT